MPKTSFGTSTAHKLAMLRNLTDQLVQHERIETTLPRAKELKRWADRVVTFAKDGSKPAKQRAHAHMRTPAAVDKLFTQLAQRYSDRAGGYTRVLHTRFRLKDNARMALVEYVDRPVSHTRSFSKCLVSFFRR